MARCNKRMERTDWCDLPAAHEGPCKFSPLERSRPAAPVTGTITIDANVLAGQILLILDNGGPWEEREAEVRSILRACHSRDGVEVAAQRTDGLRELIDALYGHLIVSDATCECGEQEIGSEEQHKKHLSAMANPTYAALIQKRDREWALVCAEHDIAALADSNGPIKLNPDALRASVREADVQAADEVLVGEVSDSIRERVCWAIRNDGSAIVAHPEKAAQPINWEAATLHLLACSKLVADCHVCRRISREAQTEGKQP